MIIVTSHWKEDLEWLKKSKFPVVLIDKEGSAESSFVPKYVIPNKGGAESTYFKYIIENYENLPEHIAFLHGHENAYHQKHERSLLEVIEGANLTHGYIPLSGWVRFYPFFNEVGVLNSPDLWDSFHLPSELKPKVGSLMAFQPNSQFIVSKERILKHPKELYEHMYNVLMTEPKEYEPYTKTYLPKHYAMLENIFHIIFGENQEYFYDPTWFNFDYVPVPWDSNTADFLKMKLQKKTCTIIFAGLARIYEECYPNIYQNLIKPNLSTHVFKKVVLSQDIDAENITKVYGKVEQIIIKNYYGVKIPQINGNIWVERFGERVSDFLNNYISNESDLYIVVRMDATISRPVIFSEEIGPNDIINITGNFVRDWYFHNRDWDFCILGNLESVRIWFSGLLDRRIDYNFDSEVIQKYTKEVGLKGSYCPKNFNTVFRLKKEGYNLILGENINVLASVSSLREFAPMFTTTPTP